MGPEKKRVASIGGGRTTIATRRWHNREITNRNNGRGEAPRRGPLPLPPPPGRINNPLETPLRQAYGPCDEYSVSGTSGGMVSGCRRAALLLLLPPSSNLQASCGLVRRNYKYTPPCFRCGRSREAADRWILASAANLLLHLPSALFACPLSSL